MLTGQIDTGVLARRAPNHASAVPLANHGQRLMFIFSRALEQDRVIRPPTYHPAWPRVSLTLQLSSYCSIDKLRGVFLFSGD